MKPILLTMALSSVAMPALAAGTWGDAASITSGQSRTFTFNGSDAANAQPVLLVPGGEVAITAVATNSAISVIVYAVLAPGSDDPTAATNKVICGTFAATTSTPVTCRVPAGYVLDVDIDTDGDGGSLTVQASQYQMALNPIDGRVGTNWLRQGRAFGLAAFTGRFPTEPLTGSDQSAGAEGCFYDFTDANDFSIARPNAFAGATGAVDNNAGVPVITSLAVEAATEVTPSTSSINNVADISTWAQNHIGVPDNYYFDAVRATGAGNQMVAAVRIGTDTNATGIHVYNTNCGFGVDTLPQLRWFTGTWRIRKSAGSSTPGNACWWLGFSNTVLNSDVALTAACATFSSATSKYVGVRVDTSGNIRVVMNQALAFTLDYDTGLDMPASASFVVLEMVALFDGATIGTFSNASYFDFYVNGQLLRQSGRAHSIEPSDMGTPWNILADPMSLAMSEVRINTTGGAPHHQVDYTGALFQRAVQSSTP